MIFRKSDSASAEKCAAILKNGGVVIIPTDTVYGFSGLTEGKLNTDKKIRMIKGREESKPMIQLIAKPEDIYKYTKDKIPEKLFSYWPGPLTVIVNDLRYSSSDKNVTTAFRCPGDEWLRKVIELCGNTIFSTSVNRSGQPVLDKEIDLISEFEKEVDVIVLDGDKLNALPSTIVSISSGNVKVLRQGALKIEL